VSVWREEIDTLTKTAMFATLFSFRREGSICGVQWSPNGEVLCVGYSDGMLSAPPSSLFFFWFSHAAKIFIGAIICLSPSGEHLWRRRVGGGLKGIAWLDSRENLLCAATADEQIQIISIVGNTLVRYSLLLLHPPLPAKLDYIRTP